MTILGLVIASSEGCGFNFYFLMSYIQRANTIYINVYTLNKQCSGLCRSQNMTSLQLNVPMLPVWN